MKQKEASSQAAWALLMEGVAQARVDGHRIQQMIERAMKLISQSEHEEHLYQVAGDIIEGLPRKLDRMLINLDRTSFALAKMGEDFLSSRLPLEDKTRVEEAVDPVFGRVRDKMTRKIALRYLRTKRDA